MIQVRGVNVYKKGVADKCPSITLRLDLAFKYLAPLNAFLCHENKSFWDKRMSNLLIIENGEGNLLISWTYIALQVVRK